MTDHKLRRVVGICALFLLTFIFSLSQIPAVHADTFIVNSTNGGESGSCDPAPGDCTLLDAVEAANLNPTRADVIQFDIPLPATILLDEELEVESILTIEGPGRDQLTINGQDNQSIFELESETGDFFEITIRGLTLTGGREIEGGAIAVYEDVILTLEDCRITENVAPTNIDDNFGTGGAIYITEGNQVVIRNCILSDNLAEGSGGAIYAQDNVTLTIIDSEITGNSTESQSNQGEFGPGGGIYMEGASLLTLDNSLVSNNQGGDGAGIYLEIIDFSDLVLVNLFNSQINDNQGDDDGGGLYAEGGDPLSQLNIFNTTFQGNRSSESGGGLAVEALNIVMVNSTIANNRAGSDSEPGEGQGGGLYYEEGELTIINSTISGNETNRSGGGLVLGEEVMAMLMNVTLFGNAADADGQSGAEEDGNGGGIYVEEPEGVQVEISNSIVAGNVDPNGSPDCSGLIFSRGFNLIGNSAGCLYVPFNGDLVGTAEEPIDPALDPQLANNGGPTPTHALFAGSPAIDAAGGNSGCGLDTDQRGILRPQGARCDMGAFELVVIPTPIPPNGGDGGGGGITGDSGGGCGLNPASAGSLTPWMGLMILAYLGLALGLRTRRRSSGD